MPIRVKPVQTLNPCVLDLESIRGICELVQTHFLHFSLTAQDGIWEAYGYASIPEFLEAISQREKLDSFSVEASSLLADEPTYVSNTLSLTFSQTTAEVRCVVPPEYVGWYEHLIFTSIKNCLKPPGLLQRLMYVGKLPSYSSIGFFGSALTHPYDVPISYCRIIIKKKAQTLPWRTSR